MPKSRRRWQLILSLFLVWHMTAIALYLMPPTALGVFQPVRAYTAPYVLLFSQWQKWDIFSPDPLRRTSEYRIDRQTFKGWETVKTMDFHSLHWTVRAKELKVLGRLEDNWSALVSSYLLASCDEYPTATVRLVVTNMILPRELRELRNTANTSPPKNERVLGTASCDSAS